MVVIGARPWAFLAISHLQIGDKELACSWPSGWGPGDVLNNRPTKRPRTLAVEAGSSRLASYGVYSW